MKIVITGSLGHISKPLVIDLIKRNYQVTVISHTKKREKEIQDLGAQAAIGSLSDVHFLTAAFNEAAVVYCMIPPNNYFDQNLDLIAYYEKTASNYAQAIKDSGVKKVVYLSSIGAHMPKDSGIIVGHNRGEAILNKLDNVAITFMRPVGFYYNLFGFIPMIKATGMIAANWGMDEILVWVSPKDISAAIVDEIENGIAGKNIRYVASDELSGNESATILGNAIGKPSLKWNIISNEEMLNGLISVGMNLTIAAGLVKMYESQQNGLLMEDYHRNKPTLGKVKLKDFAGDFAEMYNA